METTNCLNRNKNKTKKKRRRYPKGETLEKWRTGVERPGGGDGSFLLCVCPREAHGGNKGGRGGGRAEGREMTEVLGSH